MIHLDSVNGIAPDKETIQAITEVLHQNWTSTTSPCAEGDRARENLQGIYSDLYEVLEASDDATILLTSSGVESVNHIVHHCYHDLSCQKGKNHFLVAITDEAPAILATGQLEDLGCTIEMIPVNEDGVMTQDLLIDHISPRTALLSISWANGLTGVVQLIDELSQLCQERGVALHLEGSHAFGKLFLDLEEVQPNFFSLSAEQIHGPQGVGLLYASKEEKLESLLLGGAEQGGMRAGEINLAIASGFACALKKTQSMLDHVSTEVARLRDLLEGRLSDAIPDFHIFYRDSERLPNISAFAIPGVSGEALACFLAKRGIAVSLGGGRMQKLNLLLQASGVDPYLSECAVSCSFSYQTTEDQVNLSVELILECARSLRKVSGNILSE